MLSPSAQWYTGSPATHTTHNLPSRRKLHRPLIAVVFEDGQYRKGNSAGVFVEAMSTCYNKSLSITNSGHIIVNTHSRYWSNSYRRDHGPVLQKSGHIIVNTLGSHFLFLPSESYGYVRRSELRMRLYLSWIERRLTTPLTPGRGSPATHFFTKKACLFDKTLRGWHIYIDNRIRDLVPTERCKLSERAGRKADRP